MSSGGAAVCGHQAQGSGGKNYENDRRPVESIYTEVTSYLIQHCHTMDVLALAGINKKAFNIPSWVPDWSQQFIPTLSKQPLVL